MPEAPFPPLGHVVEQIAALTAEQFAALHRSVSGEKAYDYSQERLQSLRQELGGDQSGPDVSELFFLLSALDFLYNRLGEWDISGRGRQAELNEFIGVTGLVPKEASDEARRRLVALVQDNPFLERRRKLQWLRTGILETAVEFASFVDIRPAFDKSRSLIEDSVLAIVLRIGTELHGGDDRAHVFQLTEEGLSKLKEVVEDIEKKLTTIKAQGILRLEAK